MSNNLVVEQTSKVSVNEFASRLRRKYPGSYDDLSDMNLTLLFLKKFPVYNDFVDFGEQQQPKQQIPQKTTKPTDVAGGFSCILKNKLWGPSVKQEDANHIFYSLPNYPENQFHFYSDGKFLYKDVSPFQNQNGTWVCDGEDNFVIKTEDDAQFDSVSNKWTYHVNSQPGTAKKQTSDIQPTGEKKYLKIGDKGELVGKLQNLLISKGFKNISKGGQVDNIFGTRTKNSVIDFQTKNNLNPDGIVGPNTWEKLTGSRIISESELIKKIVHKNLTSLIN